MSALPSLIDLFNNAGFTGLVGVLAGGAFGFFGTWYNERSRRSGEAERLNRELAMRAAVTHWEANTTMLLEVLKSDGKVMEVPTFDVLILQKQRLFEMMAAGAFDSGNPEVAANLSRLRAFGAELTAFAKAAEGARKEPGAQQEK